MSRIRLTTDLPIGVQHGCQKGQEFKVIRFENRGRGQNNAAVFKGKIGQECTAFEHEYEVVSDAFI